MVEGLFEGLRGYEIVLLVLGALLFVVLICLFVFLVIRRQSTRALLALFPLPIVMIGFPGISKVRFESGIIEIETKTNAVAQNPSDPKAREELATAVSQVEARPITSTSTRLVIANAQAALGERQKALGSVESVLRTKPQMQEAVKLRERLLTDR